MRRIILDVRFYTKGGFETRPYKYRDLSAT
jgi:hypothetical protein